MNYDHLSSETGPRCVGCSATRSPGSLFALGRYRRHVKASRGFTVIELMIGLILVSILATIGLPLFRSFILNQELRAATSDLRIALTTARSEAIKRNRVVELTPFDEDEGWGSGWTIHSPNPDDPHLLVHLQDGEVNITTEPALSALRFSPMGRVLTEALIEVNVGPADSVVQGCMRLGLDGQITSLPGACSRG